jgi:Ca2+ transporting ATPase
MRYPSTIALSILVVIEMLNALNSLSEEESLVSVPPWSNPWLIGAIILSFVLHLAILYIPWLAGIFNVAPLEWADWQAVWWFSAPVLLVDEVLKWLTRRMVRHEQLQKQRRIGGGGSFDDTSALLEKEV